LIDWSVIFPPLHFELYAMFLSAQHLPVFSANERADALESKGAEILLLESAIP
jgi:hypothetical protein